MRYTAMYLKQSFYNMRLTPQQIDIIRATVAEVGGADARVRLFGSRLDDNARGGDIDLLVETPHPVDEPATMIARLSARIGMRLGGRKIDVLLDAPNLQRFPIHEVAKAEGVAL